MSNPIDAKKLRCRRRFLRYFPHGFSDERYLAWERDYKAEAHARWKEKLSGRRFAEFLAARQYDEVAVEALRIEARTNLLFSFEKMALRDAVRTASGARRFAEGLYAWLHGRGSMQATFDAWCEAIAELPRRQTRVLTWPVVTVFGFLAQPGRHIFLKPNVTRLAAVRYGFDFHYRSRPNWTTYAELLDLAALVRLDQRDLGPRDFIDAQSFLWVQGSEEYQGRSFRPADDASDRPSQAGIVIATVSSRHTPARRMPKTAGNGDGTAASCTARTRSGWRVTRRICTPRASASRITIAVPPGQRPL